MRFFTPELVQRCQSDDPDILDRAERDWERANVHYERHLECLFSRFSPEAREMAELLLHDARIDALVVEAGELWMWGTLNQPEHQPFLLRYQLLSPPTLQAAIADPDPWQLPVWFAWDELDLEPSEPSVYLQSIYLRNGWLLSLRFSAVRLIRNHSSLAASLAVLPAALPTG
jgi:hypothetical protein